MLILILIFIFNIHVFGKNDIKRHLENSVIPINKEPPEYNVETWVKELNLQHCVIVEIGEKYCAVSYKRLFLLYFKLFGNIFGNSYL